MGRQWERAAGGGANTQEERCLSASSSLLAPQLPAGVVFATHRSAAAPDAPDAAADAAVAADASDAAIPATAAAAAPPAGALRPAPAHARGAALFAATPSVAARAAHVTSRRSGRSARGEALEGAQGQGRPSAAAWPLAPMKLSHAVMARQRPFAETCTGVPFSHCCSMFSCVFLYSLCTTNVPYI